MFQKFKDLLVKQEIQNNKTLKIYYIICFIQGVNVKYAANFKDPIKLLNVFLITLALIGLWGEYCLMWRIRHAPFVDIADSICTANQVWISLSKLIYLACVQHKCYDLLKIATSNTLLHGLGIFDLAIHCKDKLLQEIKEILEDSWIEIKYQVHIYGILCIPPCCLYMFPCLYFNYYYTHVQPQNFTLQLPVPAVFPMWERYGTQFPYYPIQFIIAGSEVYISGMSAVCFDGLYVILVVHCSALFKILCKLVEHATDEDIPKTERVKYLICCVQLHKRIYRYYEQINSLFRYTSLIQCLLSMMALCIIMFQTNVGLGEDIILFLKMVTFFFAASFEIAIYCYNGQKIITQSEKLPSAWYSCSWYEESKQFKFIILMMGLLTNRPLQLQVSGFTTMSHITLLSIFNSSGSYFLLLRNLSGMD